MSAPPRRTNRNSDLKSEKRGGSSTSVVGPRKSLQQSTSSTSQLKDRPKPAPKRKETIQRTPPQQRNNQSVPVQNRQQVVSRNSLSKSQSSLSRPQSSASSPPSLSDSLRSSQSVPSRLSTTHDSASSRYPPPRPRQTKMNNSTHSSKSINFEEEMTEKDIMDAIAEFQRRKADAVKRRDFKAADDALNAVNTLKQALEEVCISFLYLCFFVLTLNYYILNIRIVFLLYIMNQSKKEVVNATFTRRRRLIEV